MRNKIPNRTFLLEKTSNVVLAFFKKAFSSFLFHFHACVHVCCTCLHVWNVRVHMGTSFHVEAQAWAWKHLPSFPHFISAVSQSNPVLLPPRIASLMSQLALEIPCPTIWGWNYTQAATPTQHLQVPGFEPWSSQLCSKYFNLWAIALLKKKKTQHLNCMHKSTGK